MGKILATYKKALFDELVDNVTANSSHYYGFAASPIEQIGAIPAVTNDPYSTQFYNSWSLLFGVKLANTDFAPMIRNIPYVANTVYTRWDYTSNTVIDKDYYVCVSPATLGGYYHVFKCIDNASSNSSLNAPDQLDGATFTKADGYKWRYVYSISHAEYSNFATLDYIPVFSNSSLVAAAFNYSGVDVVAVANGGTGYNTYHNGMIKSTTNSTLLQIEATASLDSNFYTNSSIYIYNLSPATADLSRITNYVSNLSGNWVYLQTAANTGNILPSVTQYKIAPTVNFNTDGTVQPAAYATVNTSTNGIHSIVMINTGYGISRANVNIIANTTYGSGANLYCLTGPPGGHGTDNCSELQMKGIGIFFKYVNDNVEFGLRYNKIGIIKNPFGLGALGVKGAAYTGATFSQLMVANVVPSITTSNGELVVGQTSKASGLIAAGNTTIIKVTGDKHFVNNEVIISSNTNQQANLKINTLGNIYTKELRPLYVENVDNIIRSNNQTESFKLVIQI